MKQRYCPYCDQKMTSGIYCKGCKRIVLHPYMQDVDYYLNERHPQHESGCLYHDGGSEYPGSSASDTDPYSGALNSGGTLPGTQGGKKTNRDKKTTDPFQNMGNRTAGQRNAFEHMKSQLEQYLSQADTYQSGASGSQFARNIMDRVNSERGRKKPLTGILIVVIIWLVFSVGGNLLFLITNAIRESVYGIENVFDSSEGDLWSSGDFGAEKEVLLLGNGELSAEEVRAAGIRCNSYGHYETSLEDFSAALEQVMGEHGITAWGESEYSYNYESSGSSCYNTDHYFSLNRDRDYLGDITVFVDTATDQLHGIGVSGSDEESFYELADIAEQAAYESGCVETAENGHDIYNRLMNQEDAIIGRTEDSIDALSTEYGSEIYVSRTESSGSVYYSMEIYAPGFYTDTE